MKKILYSVSGIWALASSVAYGQVYQVIIENLAPSGGLYFTPTWTGFHDGSFDFFDAGAPASNSLEILAEQGDTSGLNGDFGTANGRISLTTNEPGGPGPGLFAPGSSTSFTLNLDTIDNRYLSFAAMLLPSNDAFFGNDSATAYELFNGAGQFLGTQSFTVLGEDIWDSGTELNDTFDAPFSTIGGTSTNTSGVVTTHAGLDNFLGTTLGDGNTLNLTFGDSTPIARITVAAIPEPSTYVAIFSGMALAFTICQRKRIKKYLS